MQSVNRTYKEIGLVFGQFFHFFPSIDVVNLVQPFKWLLFASYIKNYTYVFDKWTHSALRTLNFSFSITYSNIFAFNSINSTQFVSSFAAIKTIHFMHFIIVSAFFASSFLVAVVVVALNEISKSSKNWIELCKNELKRIAIAECIQRMSV